MNELRELFEAKIRAIDEEIGKLEFKRKSLMEANSLFFPRERKRRKSSRKKRPAKTYNIRPETTILAGMRLAPAIKKFLEMNPEKSFTSDQVAKGLLENGYKTKANFVLETISSGLSRLAKERLIIRTGRVNGGRAYIYRSRPHGV